MDMIGENLAVVAGTCSDYLENVALAISTSQVLGSKAHEVRCSHAVELNDFENHNQFRSGEDMLIGSKFIKRSTLSHTVFIIHSILFCGAKIAV